MEDTVNIKRHIETLTSTASTRPIDASDSFHFIWEQSPPLPPALQSRSPRRTSTSPTLVISNTISQHIIYERIEKSYMIGQCVRICAQNTLGWEPGILASIIARLALHWESAKEESKTFNVKINHLLSHQLLSHPCQWCMPESSKWMQYKRIPWIQHRFERTFTQ